MFRSNGPATSSRSRSSSSPVAGPWSPRPSCSTSWGLEELRGRLVELVVEGDGVTMTAAADVILDSQEAGEPVAWVSATPTIFSPEDMDLAGVDLSALAVVRVRSVLTAARSAERLLRSGAFGVVVLDLGPNPQVPPAVLGKLVKLAQLHDAAVLALTVSRRTRGTLGSLVSLRMVSHREREREGVFRVWVEALKDKRHGPGWTAESVCCGPPGLR